MKRNYIILMSIIGTLLPIAAGAQTTALNVEGFEPQATQKTSIVNIATADLLPAGIPSVGLFVHFVDDALELSTVDGSEQHRLLDDQLKTEFAFGLGLFGFMEFGAVVPLTVYQTGDNHLRYNKTSRSVSSFAFSDPRLNVKASLFPDRTEGLGVALNLTGYLPLGNTGSFHSDGRFRIEPRLIVDWKTESFKIALNGGYQFRPEKVLRNVGSSDWLMFGAGTQFNFNKTVGIFGTFSGGISLAEGRDPTNLKNISSNDFAKPMEAHAGLRFDLEGDWTINMGGGLGLSEGIGAPDFRVFGGIEHVAFPSGMKAYLLHSEEDIDPAKIDTDSDGIYDVDDKCPNVLEDIDSFEDEDGCPDADNDQDGILDNQDECPNVKGILEKQGCPFLDADKDGIDDENDACVNEAEDKDNFEDEDGCPDLDNDHDGIPDAVDKCPLKPEVINGVDDEDGCPDASDSKVRVTKDQIEIFEMVYFDTSKSTIQKRSLNILNQVRSVLRANPRIKLVRIEGHTDSQGSVESNQKLSQARAEAVLDFLSKAGIAKDRLVAVGYGEKRPVADNKFKEGRTENRRVEFFMLKVDSK